MTLPASIRVNVRAPFPARAQGSSFIVVSKANGVYTIKPNYQLLTQAPGLTATQIVAVYDTATGVWTYVPTSALQAPAAQTSRTPIADASYSALITDRNIAYTSITGPRTVTLPSATSYPQGTLLTVFDESGSCSPTNTITIAAGASNTINGATVPAVIETAYGYMSMQTNGATKWTILNVGGVSLS